MGEADIRDKTRIKAIADFLQRLLPEPASSSSSHTETDAKKMKKKQPPPPPSRNFEVGTQTELVAIHSISAAALYETPKPRLTIGEISDDHIDYGEDVDVDFDKGDTRASGRGENVGSKASPYILPYLSNRRRRHLDTRYGNRKDGDSFKICDSTVLVDTDSESTIQGKGIYRDDRIVGTVNAQDCGSDENDDRRSEKI